MTTYERIEAVIRYVDAHQDEQPDLDTLAKVAGLSRFHFHRLFTRWAGTTPKSFVQFLTSAHAKSLLERSKDVLSASLEAGLSGPGRLHDLLVSVEGMTPGEYKSGGAGVTIRHGVHDTPFGRAFLAAAPRGVCRVEFLSSAAQEKSALRELARRWPKARLVRDPAAAAALAKKMFRRGGKLTLLLAGTPFQLKVWEALLRVPAGSAVTYGALAAAVGAPKASRAVGTAVGSNALAYLIPCHRVIQGTGAFGNYRWGPSRKRAMLAWESARSGGRTPA